MWDTVAIVGVGLIGGSLGMALRERRLARTVIGIPRRAETIAEALSAGAIDEGTTDLSAASRAELVVLAPPVLQMAPLAEALSPHLKPGAVLTDVGSTKAALLAELESCLPAHVDLIGGHPMAGSERGGVHAGRPDLFEGAVWILVRTARSQPENLARLAATVRALGAVPVEMEPALHDDAVARISHLPHVIAAALAEAADRGEVASEVLRLLVAGGFKSTTRIAASPPEMWRDICLTNRDAILAALDDFEGSLGRFREALEAGSGEELLQAFSRGKAARDFLVPPAESP
jgi:prephenate dehydrogenase